MVYVCGDFVQLKEDSFFGFLVFYWSLILETYNTLYGNYIHSYSHPKYLII